jgi:hypothetical protein
MRKIIALLIFLILPTQSSAQTGVADVILRGNNVGPFPIVTQFSMDPSNAANLTFGVAPSVLTILDISGNSRNASQSNASLQGDQLTGANGINSVSVMGLGLPTAGADSYPITSGTTFTQNVSGIWIDGVVELGTANGPFNLILNTTASGSGNRFAVSVLTSNKIRVSTKRVQADAALTTDSLTCEITVGVASTFGVAVDYTSGVASFWVDDCFESRVIGTGGWDSGLGATENLPSASAPVLFRNAASRFVGKAGEIRIGTGIYVSSDYNTRRAYLQPKYDTPLQKLAFNEDVAELQNRVYKRATLGGYVKSYTIRVTSGGDTSIDCRTINAATGVANGAFATVGTSSGLLLTINYTFPDGSSYLQCKATGQADASLVQSSNRIGVGDVILIAGTSDTRYWWFNTGVPYPSGNWSPASGVYLNPRRYSGFGWFPVSWKRAANQNDQGTNEPNDLLQAPQIILNLGGNGLAAFGSQWETTNGWPVGIIAVSVGGTFTNTWDVGGSSYQNMLNVLNAAGGPGTDISAVIFGSGTVEASRAPGGAGYDTIQTNATAAFRSVFGANTPMFVSLIGGLVCSYCNDTDSDLVRQGQQTYIAANVGNDVRLAYTELDKPLNDNFAHYSPQNNSIFALRAVANLSYFLYGNGATAEGPVINGATVPTGTDTITLTVSHGTDGSTSLLDGTGSGSGTGLTGYVILRNGLSVVIGTAALSSGTILLTVTGLNAQPSDTICVKFSNGAYPGTYTNPTYGNATVPGTTTGAPVQPTNGCYPVTVL